VALNPYLTQAVGKAALDSIVDTLDVGGAGTIKFYTTAQAATANTAVGAQTLLATLTYAATAYGAATTADPSVATAAAITSDSSADATGTVVWARHASGGGTTVFDCSAGAASGTFDIEFNTDAFVAGATVAVSALTVTLPLRV
jgi:hypothetical protein